MIDSVFALAVIGAEGAQQQNPLSILPMIGIMVMIFYFLIMRPQQKKQKEHQEMLGGLKKGDRIITNGGFYGRITGLSDDTVTVELADRIRVKMSRSGVAGLADPGIKKQ